MEIRQNVSLKEFNTFGIEVNAKNFVTVYSSDEVSDLLGSEIWQNNRVQFLGGGSNVLFTEDFQGLVIKNEIKGIEVIEDNEDFTIIRSGSGEVWHDLVMYSLENRLIGLENLSLIPGTVGAAPMQNIGAYGVEIKNVFEELEALDLETGSNTIFNKEDCQFGYRESIFKKDLKGKVFITSVTLKLWKKSELNTSYGAISEVLNSWDIDTPTATDISKAVISIRQSKLPDPSDIGNGGSFFKNPVITKELYQSLKEYWPGLPGYEDGITVKVPAAWLIEQCGWKGKRIGDIGVHKNQALVLVNYGGGSGADIVELAHHIQTSVKDVFQIQLVPEVNII